MLKVAERLPYAAKSMKRRLFITNGSGILNEIFLNCFPPGNKPLSVQVSIDDYERTAMITQSLALLGLKIKCDMALLMPFLSLSAQT